MVHTGLQLCQAIFTHSILPPRIEPQNTFGVIICASSCVVFTHGAPVSSRPLVVQIIQILKPSRAGCCKEQSGWGMEWGCEWDAGIVQRYTCIPHKCQNSLLESNDCCHGDARYKQLLLSMINAQCPWGEKREQEERKTTPLALCNLKLTLTCDLKWPNVSYCLTHQGTKWVIRTKNSLLAVV